MPKAKDLLSAMESRYGKTFIRDLENSCDFTHDDFENVLIIFKAAIYYLDRYCIVQELTLTALRAFSPSIEGVRMSDDNEERVSEEYFKKVRAEIFTMKQIIHDMNS
jgi:hypothetical protein